jgi:hypothetical protein
MAGKRLLGSVNLIIAMCLVSGQSAGARPAVAVVCALPLTREHLDHFSHRHRGCSLMRDHAPSRGHRELRLDYPSPPREVADKRRDLTSAFDVWH